MIDILGFRSVLFRVRRENDVAVETLECFREVFIELFERRNELFLLIRLAEFPVSRFHLVDHRLVAAVDNRVQRVDGVF